ncbi:MAG: L,D-transpeptidase family protein [Halopseudomonas sp.]
MIDAAEYYATLPSAGWAPIGNGPLLRADQHHSQIEILRQLLTLYGDYRLPMRGRVTLAEFDPLLVKALRSFQGRHGLKPDAVLGPKTRLALDIPPQVRVFQLLLNHERQLALKKRVPSRYVQVNVPEFRLRLFEDQQSLLEMKTIVGRKSRGTPIFDTEIKSLLLNPPWNVPRSIAYKDILPKWQADADYLDRHQMRVVSGWGQQKVWVDPQQTTPDQLYKGSDYQRLYQLPGRHNALGQIKFDSPNGRAIYLHDTPSKSLFDRQQRMFSSGCVRVENPRLLAQYLLQAQTLEHPLASLLEQPQTHRIRLEKPVGLYLTYWTAWLDSAHKVQFREDIYQRDQPQKVPFEVSLLTPPVQELKHGPEPL